MKLSNDTADLFIPDDASMPGALARTTYLCIAAHQDDIEIMAAEGILHCHRSAEEWFAGVVMTDGSGSARSGPYANVHNREMAAIRRQEQRNAAMLGNYGAMLQLDFSSAAVKDCNDLAPVNDLVAILEAATPHTVYTHNLADKHPTHVAVALHVVQALRTIPKQCRPKRVLGVEVWRSLDWMLDEDKAALDSSRDEHLQAALLAVFDSQVAGGKRYDLATLGRRRANATYHAWSEVDDATGLDFAMDLTPLMYEPMLDPVVFVGKYIDRFRDDTMRRIESLRCTRSAT